MRGRNNNSNNRKSNPLTRVYESNGPDVKIRGTASHIAEKYIQLARDAQSSGDPVAAENYYQHAEHYFRLIAAAQEQFRQNTAAFLQPGAEQDVRATPQAATTSSTMATSERPSVERRRWRPRHVGPRDAQPPFGTREPQPYLPRDAQPFPPRDSSTMRPRRNQQPRNQRATSAARQDGNVDRLPSFITGGRQPRSRRISQAPATQGYGQGERPRRNQGRPFPDAPAAAPPPRSARMTCSGARQGGEPRRR